MDTTNRVSNAQPTMLREIKKMKMTVEDIEKRFTYHKPKPGQPEMYTSLRGAARSLALQMLEMVPEGREKALAITKLEESIMWANAGIARHG